MHSPETLPPIEALAAVIAARRSGSFTAAAEMLGLTHGAVSRRVHAVEHWLGTPLFERHGRGVRITPAGQRFVAQVEQALASIRDSADRWRPRRDLPVVRLSVVPSFARLWLMPRLRELQGAPPLCRIELQIEHRVADLRAGQSDLAIRYGRGRWRGVDSRLLFGETLFPVASPGFAAESGLAAGAGRIAGVPLLHDSDTGQWRTWLRAAGTEFRAKASDRRFEDYDLVLAAARAGLGVALLRSPLVEDALADGRLVRIAGPSIGNVAGHFLATAPGESRAPVCRLADRLLALTAGMRR
ncbi:LysR family transcriptional regulator [Luteimonas sp. SJ-92]|uniref:LysR family transcriptional regulator n=1 Tax=Luteimonas salinisoli TaxID=2752307 RepID=A0A853JB45_9GAMM|nr:LysR substrate-binding domain-containing protein [Luteimonas salinisoli]NZA26443.1 LysR family transcriptional regulator [Luteimonas salinisoli]